MDERRENCTEHRIKIEEIEKKVAKMDKQINGDDGSTGIRKEMTVIGVKFWIILIFLISNTGMFIKLLLGK